MRKWNTKLTCKRKMLVLSRQYLLDMHMFFLLMSIHVSLLVRRLRAYYKDSGPRAPSTNHDVARQVFLRRLYEDENNKCYPQLRMRKEVFHNLVERLETYGLKDSRFLSAKEQLAMFLAIVNHDERYSSHVCHFFRSSETIYKYFHQVLHIILKFYKDVVKPATPSNSPYEGTCTKSWRKYFKDAIGAIDGTHFLANVPLRDQARYRNRHNKITQNVLVACDFDMKFTYVLTGWEGSAHDGKLLNSAVNRNGIRLTLPAGKYYLGDAGFPLVEGILTPYRGTKYHLREHSGVLPSDYRELFNYRHSVLRNVVERTIGLLKKRFAYLRGSSFHDVQTQSKIISACCAIHNYLCEVDANDRFWEADDDSFYGPGQFRTQRINTDIRNAWGQFQDSLAHRMWNELGQGVDDDDSQ